MIHRVAILDNLKVDGHIMISPVHETPERTQAIRSALREIDDARLYWSEGTAINHDEFMSLARLVHDEKYLAQLTNLFADAEITERMTQIDSDCYVDDGTREAMHAALGCVKHAVRLIVSGETTITRAFCNIRPPGHHACADKAMGFCMVNNLAIGVKLAGLRAAIIDWDFHHGNGTQNIFWNDPNVCYISMHGDNILTWPGTGDEDEKGAHDNVLNICLEERTDHNKAIHIFDTRVLPKLAKFNPEILFVSCGFDAHALDPIGSMRFTAETYGYMTRALVKFADVRCAGRIISMLEGGYNVKALKESSVAHVKALLG